MDKFSEALIKLIEAGTPLAKYAIIGHYALWALHYLIVGGLFAGGLVILGRAIRRGQDIIAKKERYDGEVPGM